MNNNNNKISGSLVDLCSKLNLGEPISEPIAVTGGFLHKMYAIDTKNGKYAVKALNPQIMLRPHVMQNLINSEKIAKHMKKEIPALAALEFHDNVVHQVNDQYYMVFQWINGNSLGIDEITPEHCHTIGKALATIHAADFKELEIERAMSEDKQIIEWNDYMQQGKEQNSLWITQMSENINSLYTWNKQSIETDKILCADMILSHRDMDSKNVLWENGKPIFIDWESAGYVNPMQELIEVLMYWSEDLNGNLDKDRFLALLEGYKEIKIIASVDWCTVLYSGYIGKLEWLEYSLKRSLGIESSEKEEKQMGSSQVIATIDSLISYSRLVLTLEKWLVEHENKC